MKTYNVKQIAEILDTNPETVRRWIRDKKLTAAQVSRKDGNVVTEDELQKFLKATPKYMAKFSAGIAAASPAIGIAALAGSLVAGTIGYANTRKKVDYSILPEDLKKYLVTDIKRLELVVEQKRQLIQQTEAEISSIQMQINQYRAIMANVETSDKEKGE